MYAWKVRKIWEISAPSIIQDWQLHYTRRMFLNTQHNLLTNQMKIKNGHKGRFRYWLPKDIPLDVMSYRVGESDHI
jgi:hypothetical protein